MNKQEAALKAALDIAIAVGQIVRQAGPAGIPSGHLCARMMDKMGLDTFQSMVAFLERSEIVVVRNNCLFAGPKVV